MANNVENNTAAVGAFSIRGRSINEYVRLTTFALLWTYISMAAVDYAFLTTFGMQPYHVLGILAPSH